MHSQSGHSLSNSARRARSATGRHRGLLAMSEKQIQAYLVARDTLRRIRRAASLPAGSASAGPELGACSEAGQLRDRSNS